MNYISIKVCDELYDLVDDEASAQGVDLIDVVVRALAGHFKRPELGIVPRLRRGRKRKEREAAAAAVNGNGKSHRKQPA